MTTALFHALISDTLTYQYYPYFTVKVITLFHIPQGIFVLTLHENPGLACAKLRVLRSS